jgi:hypothetical protein
VKERFVRCDHECTLCYKVHCVKRKTPLVILSAESGSGSV